MCRIVHSREDIGISRLVLLPDVRIGGVCETFAHYLRDFGYHVLRPAEHIFSSLQYTSGKFTNEVSRTDDGYRLEIVGLCESIGDSRRMIERVTHHAEYLLRSGRDAHDFVLHLPAVRLVVPEVILHTLKRARCVLLRENRRLIRKCRRLEEIHHSARVVLDGVPEVTCITLGR